MKHCLPFALLLLAACGKQDPDAAQKRWTLPLRQVSVVTDMLSGREVESREMTWRYDDEDRQVFFMLSDRNSFIVQNYLYDGPHTYAAAAAYDKETGERTTFGWANARAEKDSLGRTVLERSTGANDGEEEHSGQTEYEYDAQGRVVRRTSRSGNGRIIHLQETTYGERRKDCREEAYFREDTTPYVTVREIVYADDALKCPLTERSETVAPEGSEPDVRSITYTYDRRGRLTGMDERQGASARISSGYKYRNRRLVYETIEYYDGIARRKIRTETEYRY
ncbi:MAG: hypothetical protein LUF83_03510 [Alistipes sp.]|nr:hypothetical protein [Alistipes sp.]